MIDFEVLQPEFFQTAGDGVRTGCTDRVDRSVAIESVNEVVEPSRIRESFFSNLVRHDVVLHSINGLREINVHSRFGVGS